MKKLLINILALVMLLPCGILAANLPFTDVPQDKWYYSYVERAYNEKIMTGINETTFAPSDTMTRAMFATVLYRIAGAPEVTYTDHFKDVANGKYYSKAISWCYQVGIITGTSETTFEPSVNVRRQDVCVMLARFANVVYGINTTTDASLASFSDYTTVSTYAVESVKWAIANQLITGDQGKINPKGNATRAQCAKMILVTKDTIQAQTQTNKYTPVGCIDTFTVTNNVLTVNGWAFDQDSLGQGVQIKVYANNSLITTVTANETRDDVNQVYGITGKHGFSSKTSVSFNTTQTISVYMVDLNTQKEYLLASKEFKFGAKAGTLAAKNNKIIVLDAGHGGNDPGCSNGGVLEKNITLSYALEIGKILEGKGYTVIYTRKDDTIMETATFRGENGALITNDLRARAELGEKYNAYLFVSIHVDSASSAAKGYSIYVHNSHKDSIDLGNTILTELNKLAYTTNRGIKDGSALRVLRCNTTVSCLIELGFISGDLSILLDSTNQTKICQAIAQGIINKANASVLEPNKVLEKQPDLYPL